MKMSVPAENSPNSQPPRLDTETINGLIEIMGQSRFADLVQMFYTNASEYLNSITEWKPENGCDSLKFPVHSLKGSAGNIGATRLAAVCLELETEVKNESSSDVLNTGIKVVLNEYAQTCLELDDLVK
jgi:HPt (histidine-containing phosphotransfer) domain-containing protein